MKQYINDILFKIEKFSKRLDNEVILIKQHWIVLDEDENNKKVYIFRKNGNLLISINGNVNKAKWELLDFGNILIENDSNSYLFNHGFLDNEVLILKKDNSIEYFTLVSNFLYQTGIDNLLKLTDYLSNKYIEKKVIKEPDSSIKLDISDNNELNVFEETLYNNTQILIEKFFPPGPQIGSKVFDTKMNPLADGKYLLSTNKQIDIEAGQISFVSYIMRYNVKEKGEIRIEQQDINSPQVGDKVIFNGNPKVDGEFRITWAEKIYVENGIIVKRKIFGL